MALHKSPKKSETIEIRLSHEAKAAFMARCRSEARTASDVLRQFIEGQEGAGTSTPRAAHWRLVLAGLAGVMLGAGAAVPSLARDTGTSRAAFSQLDRNHDGLLDYEEFRAR